MHFLRSDYARSSSLVAVQLAQLKPFAYSDPALATPPGFPGCVRCDCSRQLM
jgi:hypothetical protein